MRARPQIAAPNATATQSPMTSRLTPVAASRGAIPQKTAEPPKPDTRAGEDSMKTFGSHSNKASSTTGSNVSTTTNNYVGFANFPNQVFRRAIRNGFEFSLMVVGRSGLGKSTFINTLFQAEINDPTEMFEVPAGSTARIEQKTVKLVENGVQLKLTLVDTPGFGGAIDNSKCWEPIQQYIDARYMEYLSEETKLERPTRLTDKCVHLVLYFIAPSGHGLDLIDIEFMKRLHDRANIVPLIAKADTMTEEEMKRFKHQVLRDLEKHGIKVYKFPETTDPEEKRTIEPLKGRVPFAVVGSNNIREAHGKKTRVREYAWGCVEVENMEHNDFLALREMVIRTNLIDLIDVTHGVHYENFRLRQMGNLSKNQHDKDPFTAMEDERKQKEQELRDKKRQLDKTFNDKIQERENKIKERKQKLMAREQELGRMVEAKRNELQMMRTALSELRRGNIYESKTSVFSAAVNENSANASSARDSNGKSGSPTAADKKKKTGIFSRIN
ncbi:unnamed protein product, partial [Mesorhabditis spiculigera]